MFGKPAHMHLIDDQILHRNQRLSVFLPVKVIPDHSCLVDCSSFTGCPPHALSGHCLGIDIKQNILFIKKETNLGVIGAIQPIGIFKILNVQSKDYHGINLSDLVIFRKRKHRIGFLLHAMIQKQFTGGRSIGIYRKIHAAGNRGGSVHLIHSRSHLKPVDHIHGYHVDSGHGRNQLVILRRFVRIFLSCFHLFCGLLFSLFLLLKK